MLTEKQERQEAFKRAYGYTQPEFSKMKLGHIEYDTEFRNIREYVRHALSRREAKKEVVAYASTINLNLKPLSAKQLDDFAFEAYVLNNGGEIAPEALKEYNSKLDGLSKLVPLSKIVDLSQVRTSNIIAELEGLLDDAVLGRKLVQPLDIIQKIGSSGRIDLEQIGTHFSKQLSEMTDPDFAEGYENVPELTKKRVATVLNVILKDIEKFKGVKAVTRKPRKPRKKNPAKMVKKMKFLQSDKDSGLNSINPVDIIETDILWVYNVKTRKLGAYRSLDGGLSVKGSTILNFDPEQSFCKKLRKPQDVLRRLKDAGKVDQRKILEDVRAVSSPLTGRINKDTILVKIY